MARPPSKSLLPERLTGSNDFESYLTHFAFLSQLQNWQKKKKQQNVTETEIGERAHYLTTDEKVDY